jgi:hypothetical protein
VVDLTPSTSAASVRRHMKPFVVASEGESTFSKA